MRALWLITTTACAHLPVQPVLPTTASIGCLEITVTGVRDAPHPILEWQVSNVCDHPVVVDLARARVVAIGAGFARALLAPSDPDGAFVPGWIDTGETSFVRIAYAPDLASAEVPIEVELDAFDQASHRHVILAVAPWLADKPVEFMVLDERGAQSGTP